MVRPSQTMASFQAAAGATLMMVLAMPLSRTLLEASLVGHMLVQMPLLALSGWLFGSAFSPQFEKVIGPWNRCGVPGLMLVIFTMAFWMLPRSVDSALQYTGYEALKFLSLPGAGAAVASSFRRTPPLLGGVLKTNLISMLGFLAWVYTAAPVVIVISAAIRRCWEREWRLSVAHSPSTGELLCSSDRSGHQTPVAYHIKASRGHRSIMATLHYVSS
jgi:hypothetical protein